MTSRHNPGSIGGRWAARPTGPMTGPPRRRIVRTVDRSCGPGTGWRRSGSAPYPFALYVTTWTTPPTTMTYTISGLTSSPNMRLRPNSVIEPEHEHGARCNGQRAARRRDHAHDAEPGQHVDDLDVRPADLERRHPQEVDAGRLQPGVRRQASQAKHQDDQHSDARLRVGRGPARRPAIRTGCLYLPITSGSRRETAGPDPRRARRAGGVGAAPVNVRRSILPWVHRQQALSFELEVKAPERQPSNARRLTRTYQFV